MKYFKLKQGLENSTYLTAENYEMKLKELPKKEQKKYSENKEDNSGKRYFAICPASEQRNHWYREKKNADILGRRIILKIQN